MAYSDARSLFQYLTLIALASVTPICCVSNKREVLVWCGQFPVLQAVNVLRVSFVSASGSGQVAVPVDPTNVLFLNRPR